MKDVFQMIASKSVFAFTVHSDVESFAAPYVFGWSVPVLQIRGVLGQMFEIRSENASCIMKRAFLRTLKCSKLLKS